MGAPETLRRKLAAVDNNGWVDETLPLRMLHGMRNSMRLSVRRHEAPGSERVEEPVLRRTAERGTGMGVPPGVNEREASKVALGRRRNLGPAGIHSPAPSVTSPEFKCVVFPLLV